MSRIDKVLVSEGWLRSWNNSALWVLSRTVSDHCPLVLRYNCVDWLSHKDFHGLVEEFWRSLNLT
ncbi:reverse transcriptase, partial [Trifolium medium]|nr:reverse transcriptase [Trifolium medium]